MLPKALVQVPYTGTAVRVEGLMREQKSERSSDWTFLLGVLECSSAGAEV